jgi:hypothetical protein
LCDAFNHGGLKTPGQKELWIHLDWCNFLWIGSILVVWCLRVDFTSMKSYETR